MFNQSDKRFLSCCVVLLLVPALHASTVSGRVINGSTNKPASGDEIRLFKYGDVIREEAHTTSDAEGKFSFERSKDTRYVISVAHQNVSYHSAVSSGSSPVEVLVYDAVTPSGQMKEDSNAFFLEADGNRLQVTAFFILNNVSSPPYTLTGKNTFDFVLPRGAKLDHVVAQSPGGSPRRV